MRFIIIIFTISYYKINCVNILLNILRIVFVKIMPTNYFLTAVQG